MRDTSRPLPFARAPRAVFDLSLEGMAWTRRPLLMGLLVWLPVLVAGVYRVVLATQPRAELLPPGDLSAVIEIHPPTGLDPRSTGLMQEFLRRNPEPD